jgi:hypothetical protein
MPSIASTSPEPSARSRADKRDASEQAPAQRVMNSVVDRVLDPAVFIARLIGPVFVVIGVSILLNEEIYTAIAIEAVHSPTLIYLSGLLSLPIGLAILNVQRAWTADWRVIVTVLGWLFTIGGVIRILLPHLTAALGGKIFAGSIALQVVAVIVLIIGGLLCFEGYRR